MEFFHVLNRGVMGHVIFPQTGDYIRFIHDMYIFNDVKPANNTTSSLASKPPYTPDVRNRLVDIHGWCLMNNHYHLLLSERVEGGMVRFMRKVNIGYAKYFNEKYKRHGYVFQGKTKKIPILKDGHFNHILHYIHLNPLDYLKGAELWRERTLKNAVKAEEYLAQYRWSSYQDYIGKSNFPSIVTMNFFNDEFGEYGKEIKKYIRSIELEDVQNLSLE
jgi:putative transposase